jgi:2-amino-4-hydroxy-6-hydroxymethyldihydropteridine diphosphokinase
MTSRVAIGLGSNVGDRSENLQGAVAGLARLGSVVAVSSLYETAPIGGPKQGPYLNAAALLETGLAPGELLEELLAIERRHGRERRVRWGPRTLDLDLLLYGDETVDEDGLSVPHPELTRRRFVLEPLLEIWPDAALPDGTRLDSFLRGVSDQDVHRIAGEAKIPEFPTWAATAVFVIVGMGAVAIWWLMDLVL